MRHIVLVESPNKREKILRSLEKEFPKDSWVVLATYGHIKYLPKTEYGLKFTGSNFYSDFKEMESWGKTKKEISEMLKSSRYETDIYIATDGDREGEVIAFQIVESLGLESMKIQYHRVIFNALSHQAIVDAFKNPVKFNRHFYYAGIVRRVIDRDIGYLISSFMYDDFRERYGEEIASGIGRVSAPSLSILAKKHFQRESFIEAKYRKIVVEYLYNG
ncbi:MAG: type IA DNA topoisomerase, partial [Campylobacterales bacterium]|nr:type IA DNA topoisomerase [Campylobacterales bacterium]